MRTFAIVKMGQDIAWPMSQPSAKQMGMVSRISGQGWGMRMMYCQWMRSSCQGC